jgi:formylglycine-generating enzyme required for sulfatase activity
VEAESVRARSIDVHREDWDRAIAAIAAEPKYGGLQLTAQLGIVPLGPDPESQLWEFVHLASGTRGKEIPARDDKTGRLIPTGDMGIVFVLLPGGTFTMGAQKEDPHAPNYDVQARPDETPHQVPLDPFFLGKYETTQGQWARLWHGDDSLRQPSLYRPGRKNIGHEVTLANPVDRVDWTMCQLAMHWNGLMLPTEAQWEYACRANTTTPLIAEREQLKLYANLADQTAKRAGAQWEVFEDWEDGHIVHACVGSFEPNKFGLHDMHGNVWEWCLDEYGRDSAVPRPGDGLQLHSDRSGYHVYRGGSFVDPAAVARSANRFINAPTFRNGDLGLRVARASRLP